MCRQHQMGVDINAHVYESTAVQAYTLTLPDGRAFAVTAITDGATKLGLYFGTTADIDHIVEAMARARQQLAARTGQIEPVGDTANTTTTAHANAA